MMDKEALQFLMGLRDTEVTEHNGFRFANRQLIKLPEDEPKVFSTKTLASLVDMIEKEISHDALNDLVVHVEGPTKVNVLTTLRGHLDRFNLYSAVAELPIIELDRYLDVEAMNIMLKSTFIQSDMRDKLIKVLGNVREDAIKTSVDDGMSQQITVREGVQSLVKIEMPTIIKLSPYRTFLEVEQPESEFLLRLRKGPEAALFEADGGAWKLAARKNIKAYFEAELKDLVSEGKVVVTE
jgi:hypothetical protein